MGWGSHAFYKQMQAAWYVAKCRIIFKLLLFYTCSLRIIE